MNIKDRLKKFLKLNFTCTVFILLLVACSDGVHSPKKNDLQKQQLDIDFISPPESIQTSVYWYWISDNISKEGVVRDLESMKAVGINRAFIGNIGLDDVPYGNVKMLSDEWWEIIHVAR